MKNRLLCFCILLVSLLTVTLFLIPLSATAQITQVMGQYDAYENVINIKIERERVDKQVSRAEMKDNARSGIASIDQLNVSLNAIKMTPLFRTQICGSPQTVRTR